MIKYKKFGALSLVGALTILGACSSETAADIGTSSDNADATVVNVGTGNNAMPYAYLNENDEYDGYDVAVVRAIDEKLPEYSFTFEGADFPTTLSNLESDRVALAAYEYEVNEERQEKFVYGETGYAIWDTYIVTDGDQVSPIDTFEDLAGATVYVTTATNQAAMAENYLAEHPDAFTLVYGEYTNEQIVQAVTSGAVDATLAPQYQIDNWNNSFGTNLEAGADPVHNSQAYLLYNQETDPELIEAVEGALAELVADGTIAEISEEYLGGDYVPAAE